MLMNAMQCRYAPGEPLLWVEEQEEDAREKTSESESKVNRSEGDAQGYVWVHAVVWKVEGGDRVQVRVVTFNVIAW